MSLKSISNVHYCTDFWTLRDRKKDVKRKTISENGHCWWMAKVDFDAAARIRENFGTETETSLRPEPRNLDQSGPKRG